MERFQPRLAGTEGVGWDVARLMRELRRPGKATDLARRFISGVTKPAHRPAPQQPEPAAQPVVA